MKSIISYYIITGYMNNVNEPQFYRLNCGSWLFCFVLFIRGNGDRRMHGLPHDDGRDDYTVHPG